MYSTQGELDMVECPYNKTHRMQRKRLQPHLIKCRINHPDVELQKCPFNNLHLIPEPEFVHHVTSCSDRKLITQYKYGALEVKTEDEGPRHAPVECEENWDDTEVEDYNPRKYADLKKIMRRPHGVDRSERKALLKKGLKSAKDEDKESGNCRQENLQRYGINKEDEDPYYDDDDLYARRRPPTPPPPSGADCRRSGKCWPSPSSQDQERSRSPTVRRLSRSPTVQRQSLSPTPPQQAGPQFSPDYSLDDDPYYNGGDNSSCRVDDDQIVSGNSGHSRYSEDRANYEYYDYLDPYAYSQIRYYPPPSHRARFNPYRGSSIRGRYYM